MNLRFICFIAAILVGIPITTGAAPVTVNGDPFTLVATGPGTAQLYGLTADTAGRIYMGNNSNDPTGIPVQLFDPVLFSGAPIALQNFGPAVGDGDGLTYGGGSIYVGDRDEGLRRIAVPGGSSSILIPGAAINATGSPIVFRQSDGHLFVGLGFTFGGPGVNRIDEYDAAGAFVQSFTTGTQVETMTLDQVSGVIYYASFDTEIRAFNLATGADRHVGNASGYIDGGLTYDALTRLIFVGTANGPNSGLVETIDPATGVRQPFASGFNGSLGILRELVSGDLYFLESNQLYRLGSSLLPPPVSPPSVTFFRTSTYSADSAAMDHVLGVGGFTIEDFEDTTLIDGLTINYSGNGYNITRNTLARTLTLGAPWDGTSVGSNDPENNIPPGTDVPLPTVTTFNFAHPSPSVGIGLTSFQSVDPPSDAFPITNHRLYINGVPMPGTLESLAGANWTASWLGRNVYLRVDAAPGETISSIGFENISDNDFLLFDHLATGSRGAEVATETPIITGGLPQDGGIFVGTPVVGRPGVLRGTISGTGHPGCIIQLTLTDPHPPFDTSTSTTTVDASGHWSFTVEFDDCDPVIEIVQICNGVASAPVRRHIYVDGTPPVFTAGGPGDGVHFSSGGAGGGTANIILDGSATDIGTYIPGGGVSYEWHLLGGGGSFTVLGGGGSGGTLINGGAGLNISLPPGEYDFEVIVTDAAGNKLRKRCHHSVHIPPAITSGMPEDGGIYGPGTPGSPGHVRRTITGTGHPGCTIRLTVTDPDMPANVNNNRTLSTTVNAGGQWTMDLDLDDCHPFVEVVEICDGAVSPAIRRRVYVDGTPPFFLSGGGPGDGVDYVGAGGTGLIVLGGGAGDDTHVVGGGVSYQWFLIGGDGVTRTPIGDGTDTLRLAKGLGDYVIEEVVTDTAGNKLVKRCARSVIKRTCLVQIPDAVVYYNESVALTGQVFDTIAQPNQAVPGAPLGFTVNGVAVANPAAYLATLTPGQYPIGATFPGNDVYQSAKATAKLTVLRRPTAVTTANIQVPYGTQVTLTGALSDVRLGSLLNGRALSFKINGQPVTNPFEASLPPGSYPIVVDYAGDSYYVPSTGKATLTILSTPGKITGGGSIDQSIRNFGFVVQTKVQGGVQSFTGDLQYQDKSLGYDLHSTAITGIAIAPDRVHGIFEGTATLNGKAGYTFVAWVEDWAEPGALKDKFRVTISGPGLSYDSSTLATKGGILDQGGNIQVHKPQ